MKCCNSPRQCNQNSNCQICADIKPDWRFCPMQDKAPHAELANDVFYLVGLVLFLATLCAAAGLAWGLLNRFYPSTACMVLAIFDACK